jgi:poly-gamma-glutamate synthesis protein (capsule biosynthesis protein)
MEDTSEPSDDLKSEPGVITQAELDKLLADHTAYLMDRMLPSAEFPNVIIRRLTTPAKTNSNRANLSSTVVGTFAIACVALLAASGQPLAASRCAPVSTDRPIPSRYVDAAPFDAAIAAANREGVTWPSVSGITVPHHLLAADLIARAFRLVKDGGFDRIIVLSPDHFKRAARPFATTRRDFDTVYGRVVTHRRDVERLLQVPDLVEESDLFEEEHGIGALLPFLKRALPDAAIVPIAISLSSSRADWDRLLPQLSALVGRRTLVVQSTDFSHYLSFPQAIRRDQETLNAIAASDLDAVAALIQPKHLDSRGAEYIQLRLQRERFGAEPEVLFNSNSSAYPLTVDSSTTSYVVQVFARGTRERVGPDLPGSQVFCFAGDTFFGRGVAAALARPEIAAEVRRELKGVLNGCRLILNLEGVAVPAVPRRLAPLQLAMPAALLRDWLQSLGAVAVSLANNHSMDLGASAREAMARDLTAMDIAVLRHGEILDLGAFRLAGLTDSDNSRGMLEGVVTQADIAQLMHATARPPLFAFMHWGLEFAAMPSQRQRELAAELRRAGVALAIGAHPHVASRGLELIPGGYALGVFSLGNFLFDQKSQVASGVILELRAFAQGTFFARLVPLGNVIERARVERQ